MDLFTTTASANRGSREWPSAVPALYMRGGCSKGLFVLASDLPTLVDRRDALLLRLIGSPDRYGTQLDGLGGATAATSRVVILAPSLHDDCDVDVLYGAVAIGEAQIDYSQTCSQLLAAVGPAAIAMGLVVPQEGLCRVRIWQSGNGQRVDAYVPVRDGEVIEDGEFDEDGVPFSGAEIRLELSPVRSIPAAPRLPMVPGNQVQARLAVAGLGEVAVTLIGVPVPTVFVRATALGLSGREGPTELRRNRLLIDKLEAVRAAAAVRLGQIDDASQSSCLADGGPALVFVERPAAYRSAAGVDIRADRIDLLARLIIDGQWQTQLPVDVSIALAIAAALPGSLVNELVRVLPSVPTRIGHAAGVLAVGAEVAKGREGWRLERAVLSHSARRLMSGVVHVPPARVRA